MPLRRRTGSKPSLCREARCQPWCQHPHCSRIIFFSRSQRWRRGHGGPQPPSHTSSSSRSAGICSPPSSQCSQSSSNWFLLWPLQPVVQLGWSGMTGRAPGTHLARSRCLLPGDFLRDPASPSPLDSPGRLWTLRWEREGSWSRVGDFRGDTPGDRTTGAVPPRDQDDGGFTLEDVHSDVPPSKSLCPSKTPHYPAMGSPGPHRVTHKDIQAHLHILPKPPMGGHPPPTPSTPPISPTPPWAPCHPVQPRSRHRSICGVFIAT